MQKLNLKMWLSLQYSCGCFCSSLGALEQDRAGRAALTGRASRAPCSDTTARERMGVPAGGQIHLRSLLVTILGSEGGLEQEEQVRGALCPKLGRDPAMCALPLLHKPLWLHFRRKLPANCPENFLALLPVKSTGIWANWTSQAALFSVQIQAQRQGEKVTVPKVTWEVSRVFGLQSSKAAKFSLEGHI